MEILSLNLANYRNFAKKSIIFDRNLTVIVGANGSGKSNILESVGLLSGIRPSKVETDLDLVRFGQTSAKIDGEVFSENEKRELVINFQIVDDQHLGKSFYIGSFKKRLVDFVDIFSVVIFEPADLDLVSGSPSLRRKHLDRFLSSLDSSYWRSVSAYGKIVTRRNKILQRIQEGKSKSLELGFWDERLLAHGKFISKIRVEFFEYLNFLEPTFAKTAQGVGGLTDLAWELKQSVLTEEKLLNNRQRDIAAGMTLSGPHRDDFRFKFKSRDLEFFGSRGEQRMAVLALKLAELEYLKVKRGERPILALDDIFSELDWEHRDTVFSVISNQQTIITAAEKESVPKEIFKKAKVIEL
jgi:DNA replication and repair protein RecF